MPKSNYQTEQKHMRIYNYIILAATTFTIAILLGFYLGINYSEYKRDTKVDATSYKQGYDAASIYFTTERELRKTK